MTLRNARSHAMPRRLIAALLVLAAVPASAHAQTAAPPQFDLGGPQIKGVCLLGQTAVLSQAKEAIAARAPIDVDFKALQAEASKAPPADVEKRRAAIQARYQSVQDLTDLRNREIEATNQKVVARIVAEVRPVIAAVYKAHGCGL